MDRGENEETNLGVFRFRKALIAVRFVVALVDSCTYQPLKYKAYQHNRLKKKLQAEEMALKELFNKTKSELQVEIKTQEQWDELMAKEGLIVVDAYAAWCGPCKAIISSFKRLKNEIGDDLLHFATAETDGIDTLEKYRMKSQPTFLFYAGNTLVNVVRGCHCPLLLKTIKKELEKEHKVLEGQADRARFIDDQVEKVAVEEAVEEKPPTEEEEEEEIVAEEMNRYRSSHILEKKAEKEAKLAGKEVHIPKQVTVAIIKPDAVKAGLVDEIIKKVEEMGIEVLKKEERTLTKEEAAEFYKQHEQSEHFEQLTEFMSSGPLMTLALSKAGETPDAVEGVIESFRELIGPKDVNTAKEEAPESLRALYGTDTVMNAVHGCDSSESAARELAFFFPDFVAPTVVNKRKKKRLQRTLALIRPDALRTRKDSIINKIKEAGFMIAMSKEMQLTREQAEEFYAQHKEQEFFETLVNNMISGPMMALCLAREDAVEGWREMLGPKEIEVAKEEAPDSLDQLGSGVSLRAQFQVEDSPVNPLHGSDSPEAAEKEIRKFFPLQSTVAVIKPEVESDQQEIIKQRIKEAGFTIQAQKEITLTKELASQFYQEHEGKEFFGDLTEYMASGKTMFMVLSKEDAVSGWRALMGPTDPTEAKEAAPDTLRAQFGVDKMKNIVHGSSNPEKAVEVIKEFFPEVELCPDGTVKQNYSLALGLEDGKIPDDAITASSILDDAHAAQCCRLNGKTEEKKGAWAAKDTDENQWLQVNLGQYARISRIATQGENGESASHVKSYSLSYGRDGESFVAYSDEVFEGNTDQDTVLCNKLPQPLITQYIRINPKSWNEQIALRMELYGFDADTFTESLGVADGKIPDACISASSSLDDNHSPSQCRLNAKEEGDKMAGWAAKENDENQWIQIDFGRLAEITQVSTQGKGGESTHHVTSYLLSFSTDGENFTAYQEGGQDKVFDGNADQETVVSHWLAFPPVSHYVRLHPKTWNEHIALRLDFAGRYKEQEAKEKIEVDEASAETGEAIAAGDQEQPQETTAEQEASHEGAVEDKKDDPQKEGEEVSQEKQEDSVEKPTEEPAEKPAEDSAKVTAAEGEAAASSEIKETEGKEESTEAKPEDVSADDEPAPEKSEEQPQTKDGESGGKPEGGEEQAGAEEKKKDDEPKPEGDSEKPKEGEGEATIPPEGEDQG